MANPEIPCWTPEELEEFRRSSIVDEFENGEAYRRLNEERQKQSREATKTAMAHANDSPEQLAVLYKTANHFLQERLFMLEQFPHEIIIEAIYGEDMCAARSAVKYGVLTRDELVELTKNEDSFFSGPAKRRLARHDAGLLDIDPALWECVGLPVPRHR